MTRKQWLLSSVVALTTFVSTVVVAGPIENYSPVTSARLENPEPGNWLMTRGNYKGWSYSSLDQINPSNVKSLVPVWSFSTGVDSGHEAPPIVNNGVMFISTPYIQVIALDAATGDLLWRYKPKLPEGSAPCTTPTVAWRCTATRYTWPGLMPCWSRSTPRPARSFGTRRSRIGRPATT